MVRWVVQVVVASVLATSSLGAFLVFASGAELQSRASHIQEGRPPVGAVLVHKAIRYDVSQPLASQRETASGTAVADCEGPGCGTSPGPFLDDPDAEREKGPDEAIPPPPPPPALSSAGIAAEQRSQGTRPAAPLLESFDGLGAGFEGPQGTTTFRNPSDNSLAVGPNHSIAMDKKGDIGIGYSFGGLPNFAGLRFAARRAGDPKGLLTLHESVLAIGEAAQTNTLRWEDYTTTALDPSDDCTFWYVGDYLKAGDTGYRTRIGSFRLPNCKGGR